eukprot:c18645_g1_i1.p1 GENE.c18645_g1_i1~~c18645_g1_i1.p1  ORF type:complete len:327 (+),score=43.28 c18645_g1_i1:472-1452(+)
MPTTKSLCNTVSEAFAELRPLPGTWGVERNMFFACVFFGGLGAKILLWLVGFVAHRKPLPMAKPRGTLAQSQRSCIPKATTNTAAYFGSARPRTALTASTSIKDGNRPKRLKYTDHRVAQIAASKPLAPPTAPSRIVPPSTIRRHNSLQPNPGPTQPESPSNARKRREVEPVGQSQLLKLDETLLSGIRLPFSGQGSTPRWAKKSRAMTGMIFKGCETPCTPPNHGNSATRRASQTSLTEVLSYNLLSPRALAVLGSSDDVRALNDMAEVNFDELFQLQICDSWEKCVAEAEEREREHAIRWGTKQEANQEQPDAGTCRQLEYFEQ